MSAIDLVGNVATAAAFTGLYLFATEWLRASGKDAGWLE